MTDMRQLLSTVRKLSSSDAVPFHDIAGQYSCVTFNDYENLMNDLNQAYYEGLLKKEKRTFTDFLDCWSLTEAGNKFIDGIDNKIDDLSSTKHLLVGIKSGSYKYNGFIYHKAIELGLISLKSGVYSLTEFGEEFLLEVS